MTQAPGAPTLEAAGPRPGSLSPLDVSSLTPENAVARLIEYAVYLGASDLFLLCNTSATSVQVRQHGMVRPISHLTGEFSKRCLQYIKAAAGIDLTERRRPLDGRWIFQHAGDPPVDLRINTIPTLFGEDMTIRLLVRCTDLFTLGKLGLTDGQQEHVAGMLSSSAGLVLVTGPTGSGKTMTLYACLRRLNNGERKINTIEDPIEYPIAGLRQSQVNPAVELGFYELLRGVLRQAPDVIMIGEIRDAETAETTVRAANSGHLVFATIHAATAAAVVQSMRSIGSASAFSFRRAARHRCAAPGPHALPALQGRVRRIRHAGILLRGASLAGPRRGNGAFARPAVVRLAAIWATPVAPACSK